MVLQNAFRMEFSHRSRDLQCFADRYNIPWNLPTNFHPDVIATILQRYLLSLCALLSLSQQSHLFPICVVSTYTDSRKDLHKASPNSKVVSVNDLRRPVRLQELLQAPFVFPEKFLFCTDTTGSIGWPYRWLFRHSQPSLRTLWSAVIKSPKFSARGTAPPMRLLHGALVILVLWQISQIRSLDMWV